MLFDLVTLILVMRMKYCFLIATLLSFQTTTAFAGPGATTSSIAWCDKAMSLSNKDVVQMWSSYGTKDWTFKWEDPAGTRYLPWEWKKGRDYRDINTLVNFLWNKFTDGSPLVPLDNGYYFLNGSKVHVFIAHRPYNGVAREQAMTMIIRDLGKSAYVCEGLGTVLKIPNPPMRP